ncbi:succinyldiaminopimelate transaminase [Jonesia quinghaiensis]|uniref:succinyldiaminopimelate transaminase n=1 Tax=Jonesia quinghaiensis TaxID=262806 RepID=UPI0004208EE8|nr:succinyldiaminopimelate transaminase [Jonesia quinghaiensis]
MGFADISHIAFPWDLLHGFKELAQSTNGTFVDVSVGTPVDPTPQVVQEALTAGADAPGYPLTYGTIELRQAVVEWCARRRGATVLESSGVMPTVGSKELVGLLPSLLHLGAGDVVVHPAIAYPTYDVGAKLAGATALPVARVDEWRDNPSVRLVWVNTPANPHGAVMSVAELREVVDAARSIGAIVVSDECYAELPWTPDLQRSGVPSLLDSQVNGGSLAGLLMTYSLSKQSSMAGYRAAFVAGDPNLVRQLVALRKHLGMIVPAPVQQAMQAALRDDEHVAVQRALYGARRTKLVDALLDHGLKITHSQAGLYLWVTSPHELPLSSRAETLREQANIELPGAGWNLVGYLADRGILAAPGAFYGPQGGDCVRVALTASDDAIDAFVTQLC